MIEAEKATEGVPVSRACELLGVSRSGYHEWADPAAVRPGAVRRVADREDHARSTRPTVASTALRASTPSCGCSTASGSGASGWSA